MELNVISNNDIECSLDFHFAPHICIERIGFFIKSVRTKRYRSFCSSEMFYFVSVHETERSLVQFIFMNMWLYAFIWYWVILAHSMLLYLFIHLLTWKSFIWWPNVIVDTDFKLTLNMGKTYIFLLHSTRVTFLVSETLIRKPFYLKRVNQIPRYYNT